ncbi:MAG: hypothetical protein D6729_11360 [Deltaproteobacteria bacterium]|nr:MAG: hypothetical protein D6729_11360 [Deltaproteobacteria bacterium]
MDRGGIFDADLAVETPLARAISVGGRFGVFVATRPDLVGVPLDLSLRLRFARGRAWLSGRGGLYLNFGGGSVLLGHVAIAFGLATRSLTVGLEVAYLEPSPLIGLRLGWRL